ncbi:WD repeat-containing protein 53 [Phyllopteryx taeniolatus]|uniref:WD repeat-containing protein 53 n=1 Tax=Phyllopteryx taeniolatus TaxID=161469 RepID=UPI002AD4ADF5|nr:WD repeat-containing protein 53 [Phyllopteryx taeniolatus]
MAKLWCEGHSTAILCVCASPGPEGLVASGSEGGEVAIWSQEGCVVGRLNLLGEEDCTSVGFSPAAPGILYASHGDTVSVLDPRNLKGAVKEFANVGEEEINALALNESGSTLALADDSGTVRILELPEGKACRTLRRHTNICSSVAFRPHRPNNLLSAGLDMQVMLWGLQKARPLWTLNLQDIAEEEDDHQQRPGQLFNPPLAHCVSVASCGNIVACAADDGRVHLMRVGGGSKLEQQGALKAHCHGASQAHFVPFLSHPYWLASGGNDGRVALWDVSKHPVVTLEGKAKIKGAAAPYRKGKSKAKRKGVEAREEHEADVGVTEKSGPEVNINHGDKVNWLCPALLKGTASLLVADQSSSLTVYPLAEP